MFNIFAYFNNGSLVNDPEIYKNYAGVYVSDSWEEHGDTIILQNNGSCDFFKSNKNTYCSWKIIKDKIYIYVYNSNTTEIKKTYTGIIDNDSFTINNHLFKKTSDLGND